MTKSMSDKRLVFFKRLAKICEQGKLVRHYAELITEIERLKEEVRLASIFNDREHERWLTSNRFIDDYRKEIMDLVAEVEQLRKQLTAKRKYSEEYIKETDEHQEYLGEHIERLRGLLKQAEEAVPKSWQKVEPVDSIFDEKADSNNKAIALVAELLPHLRRLHKMAEINQFPGLATDINVWMMQAEWLVGPPREVVQGGVTPTDAVTRSDKALAAMREASKAWLGVNDD